MSVSGEGCPKPNFIKSSKDWSGLPDSPFRVQTSADFAQNITYNPLPHRYDNRFIWLNAELRSADLNWCTLDSKQCMPVRNFVWLSPVLQNVNMSHDSKTSRETAGCSFSAPAAPLLWWKNFTLIGLRLQRTGMTCGTYGYLTQRGCNLFGHLLLAAHFLHVKTVQFRSLFLKK